MKALFNIKHCFIFVAVASGLIAVFLLIGYVKTSDTKLTTVQRVDLIHVISIPGTVEPEKKILITAPYDGYVQKLYVKIGDQIKQNAPIVSVAESLQSYDAVYPLRVPFAGTVVDVLKKEGEFVQRNNTEQYLVRIDQLDKLYVEFDLPELYRQNIQLDQQVSIKIHPIINKQYKGVVDRISLTAKQPSQWRNTTNVEFASRVWITQPDENIKTGMSAVVDIVRLKKENALVLPHTFVFKQDDAYFVTLKNGDEKEIQIGQQNDSHIEITEGLKEGDQVKRVLHNKGKNTFTLRGRPYWDIQVADMYPLKFQFFDWQKELLPLKSLFPHISLISPYIKGWETSVNFAGQSIERDVRLYGVSEDGLDILNKSLSIGVGINVHHVERKDSVCVIGSEIGERLFAHSWPIGQILALSQQSYNTFFCRVIGVLEKTMVDKQWSHPNLQIYIPFTVFHAFNEYHDAHITTFMVKVKHQRHTQKLGYALKNMFEVKYGVSGIFEVDF